MSNHELKVLERIEKTLQHLVEEDHEIREDLREIRVMLQLVIDILLAPQTYPRTTAITVTSPP